MQTEHQCQTLSGQHLSIICYDTDSKVENFGESSILRFPGMEIQELV